MSQSVLRCSFCEKPSHEVRKLIAGPEVYICDGCVEICQDIIAEDLAGEAGREVEVARTVTFPARHLQIGIALLAGAIRVIHGQFPQSRSELALDVDNLTVTLKVRCAEARRAEVDEALAAYGALLQGRPASGTPLDGAEAESLWQQIESIREGLQRSAPGDPAPDRLLRVLGWVLSQEIEDVEELFS